MSSSRARKSRTGPPGAWTTPSDEMSPAPQNISASFQIRWLNIEGRGGDFPRSSSCRSTLDVRVIDVKTGEIVFVDTAEGDASKSENNVSIIGVNLRNSEMSGPEGVAIAKAAAALAPKIEEALTGEDTLSEILNPDGKKDTKRKKASGKPAAKEEKKQKPEPTATDEDAKNPPQADAPQKRAAYENNSTDPAKVIATYGLPAGEANTLWIKHVNILRRWDAAIA